MPGAEARQVTACRGQLLRAVKEVWCTSNYDDQFRLTVLQACLNHGLVKGSDMLLRLTPVAVGTVEADVSRAGLLRGKTLISLLSKHTDFFRVMDKADCGPAVLPWLHDILPYPHPDVAALLATMPILRQPAPPPGIPAGIAPMRKANAPTSQVPCKHFAQGSCSKGDKCDFAHDQKQPSREAPKARGAAHETPPVDEARKVLLEALNDAWPGQDFIEIFAKTAARICIQQAFVLGKTTPYVQQVVHAPNMGTHLHKCGVGMVRGTLQQMLARPEVKPHFKIVMTGKNQPPAILCLLANAFCGHPSKVVNDIVQQTYLEEPNMPAPYMMAPSIPPRSSFAKTAADKHAESDSVSEASNASRTAAPAAVAASAPQDTPAAVLRQPEEATEAMPAVNDARMKLVMAVAQGPACEGQGGASVVRRAINYACLAKGFVAASSDDATPQHGPYLYKLQSVPVSLVGEHTRGIMDSFGYGGVQLNSMLATDDYSPYFVTGTSGSVPYVRPVFERLAPKPDPLVKRILLQTKTVNVPTAPPRTGARLDAWGSTVMPTAGTQSEGSRDGNADAASQASGDASSVTSRPEELRAGTAGSVTADDETVQEATGTHGNTTHREAPHTHPRVQIKMVASVVDANAALRHIQTCDWIAVGCEGDLSKKGRICLIQVYAAPICFIFDMVTTDSSVKAALISGLKQVLEDSSVVKIMHDCRRPAAAIRYQLQIDLCNVFDTQVAHGYLQHVSFVTGGEVDDYGAWIELECLLETYNLSLPENRDMMQPSMKHWVKRPLFPQLVEYAVGGVDPLWDLGKRMMRSVGEAGVAGTIRMSKQSIQYYYEDADKDPPEEEKRNIAVLAIGQYWLPQITEESVDEAAARAAEDADGDGQGLADAISLESLGAQDLEDRSATIHDDMPLLKAHGTKHAVAEGSSTILQVSNKQEHVKPDRLVNGQNLAPQPKMAGKTEALATPLVSPSKGPNPSNN